MELLEIENGQLEKANLKFNIWTFEHSFFQLMESPAPLNIPTPTPAPDRGLSFVAVLWSCFNGC